MKKTQKLKFISLFSGIGGFERGIEQAGIDAECIGFSEINKYAIQVYEKQYPTHRNFGDVTAIIADELPELGLLVGGFPCQTFSIAGKRRGFDDTRGTLFFDIARILKARRPRNFVLENVKGLLSHDDGRTFKTIISTLAELGYCVEWQVLNSKNFGVPQNRERVYIVGHLGGIPERKVFPIREDSQADIVLPTLTTRYYGGQANGGYIGNKQEQIGTLRTHKDGRGFRKIKENISPTIPARAREDGSGQPIIIQTARGYNDGGEHDIAPTMSANSWQNNNHLAIPVLTPDRPVKRQNGRRFKEDGDPSFTLTAQDKHGVYDGLKIRRLTPIECERLQGFPDNWTDCISDSQRYKCCGNAVTVNVVEAVIKKLYA